MPVKTQMDSMADIEVKHRGIKRTFLDDLEEFIWWKPIEKILKRHYKKTQNAAGNSAYPALPMFKILLLQRFYCRRACNSGECFRYESIRRCVGKKCALFP